MINQIIIYSLLSFLLFYFFSRISYYFNLVDVPKNRKFHSKTTAYTGGIAICSNLIISIFIFNITENVLNVILSMSFLISVVGLIDDKFHLNVGGKLSLQIIPIFYLIVSQNLFLNDIGNYYYFELKLGAFSMPFTLLCVLLLINSFNYFDGLDGTLSFSTISVLFILYFLTSDKNFELFILIFLIPIAIFLLFNFSILKLPKLFLGDSGSLLLGFIISFMLIYAEKENFIHPILLAWSISIFVFEFLSINLIRLKNKQNPFKAGLDHLHHLLYRKFKSKFYSNLIIFLLNISLFLIGYLGFVFLNPLSSLVMFIIGFLLFLYLRLEISKE